MRATGIDWVFAPTLAVAQNARWGRTYESFSSDPGAGARLCRRDTCAGCRASLRGDGTVLATAKHYIGDGGTDHGKDQGERDQSRART